MQHSGKLSEPGLASTADPIHHVDITLELSSNPSLHGRSTSVFSALTDEPLEFSTNWFAKHFWSLHDDIPESVPFHVFSDASRSIIGECLHRGARRRSLPRMLFQHLTSITTLVGDAFLKCWWDAVICHRTLWEKGVHHHDITPATLMYYKDEAGNVIGVLIDFGLVTRTEPGIAVQHYGPDDSESDSDSE